jgi:hypothetical protein
VQRLHFPGPPYAESALQVSVPAPWVSGQFTGMDHFTADELTRIHQGAQWGPISYVSSEVPSVRPDMVSVNAIDPYTWGGAAFSLRAHRCYLILSALDATNPIAVERPVALRSLKHRPGLLAPPDPIQARGVAILGPDEHGRRPRIRSPCPTARP